MSVQAELHQMKLNEWINRLAEQKASGLTVREWCKLNNLTIHKYNYWKHLIKEEDAKQGTFKAVYIVCGRTDLRYSIDSLAAIIERKYKMNISQR